MGSGSRVILVIDDNAALVENLTEVLEDAGYTVRSATNCTAARAIAARTMFHVALVDLRLPDGDGTALAAELKDYSPDAEVILLTGFATLESATAAVRAGAWAYLVKPCATADLLLAVEQAMRQVKLLEEKRELSRRAQVAEKLAAVGTMTAGLSHEIRNPLNAAALQLTVLSRRIHRLPRESQPPLLEPLQLVQSEIRRLNRILEDFLQFARPRDLIPSPVDISQVVSAVMDFLQAQAERLQISIIRKLDGVPTISGDAGLLQQAIMNLMLNAIEAAPAGGWVRVELSSGAGDVVLAIEDSGPGIPTELRQRIFEPFFTTKAAGSGLGLPLVHAIVQQHGGSISLEESSHGGARFVIRLAANQGAE